MMKFPIYGNITNVPNHQPVMITSAAASASTSLTYLWKRRPFKTGGGHRNNKKTPRRKQRRYTTLFEAQLDIAILVQYLLHLNYIPLYYNSIHLFIYHEFPMYRKMTFAFPNTCYTTANGVLTCSNHGTTLLLTWYIIVMWVKQ